MAYQMQDLLGKCNSDDLRFLAKQLDSYVNLTDDKKLKAAIAHFSTSSTPASKNEVMRLLEAEIRYVGSSEVAYAKRKLLSEEQPYGVNVNEIIDDASAKLKIKQKLVGTVEGKLERLVKWTVEKTFFGLSPEQQRELFEKAGIGKDQQKEFFDKLKGNKAHFVPLLLSVLGPEITKKIIEGIVVSVIATYLGREGAKELFKNLALRFPLWAEWLGPIVWGLSLGWLALDLQGAAYRKTIPVLLYLGIVGLRDGPEDGPEFWNESAPEI